MSATEAKTTEAKKFEAKADVAPIEAKAMEIIEMTADGTPRFKEGTGLDNLLPDGVTSESLLAGQKAFEVAQVGIERAVARKAAEAMKANPELQQVAYQLPTYGKSYLAGVLKRDGETRGAPGTDEIKKFKGHFVVRKHEVVSTRTKAEGDNTKGFFRMLAEEAGL